MELDLNVVLQKLLETANKEKGANFEVGSVTVPILFDVDPSDYYEAIRKKIIQTEDLSYHIEFLINYNDLQNEELSNFLEYIYTLNSAYDR